jgi:hypothetical protein
VTHSFLVEAGYWSVDGYWLKPNLPPISIKGGIQTAWKRDNWFKITTSLTCDDETQTKIIYQCRGNLNYAEKHYTYVSQHSLLGNIEGEGRFGFRSIVQYYWFIGAVGNKKGLDTYYRVDQNTYYLTSNLLDAHSINSTIEAILKR